MASLELKQNSRDEKMQKNMEEKEQEQKHTLQQLEEELLKKRASIDKLDANLDKQNQRKINLLNDLQQLRERFDEEEGGTAGMQKLLPLLVSLKALEKQESVLQSNYNAKNLELQAEVCELVEKLGPNWDSDSLSKDLDRKLDESLQKLTSTKKDLAVRIRAVVSVKRQLDDVPTQSELIQYERRFSELNAHIQEKHRQTRKYYATYNALLEIKELMLKEISLLNSISSQFQDAIASTDGRMKLIDSMEGIVKGSQLKLQKVQVELQQEQKVCDALKKKYAMAMAEQRHCYSLLKAFQEECAENERLQSQISVKENPAAL